MFCLGLYSHFCTRGTDLLYRGADLTHTPGTLQGSCRSSSTSHPREGRTLLSLLLLPLSFQIRISLFSLLRFIRCNLHRFLLIQRCGANIPAFAMIGIGTDHEVTGVVKHLLRLSVLFEVSGGPNAIAIRVDHQACIHVAREKILKTNRVCFDITSSERFTLVVQQFHEGLFLFLQPRDRYFKVPILIQWFHRELLFKRVIPKAVITVYCCRVDPYSIPCTRLPPGA